MEVGKGGGFSWGGGEGGGEKAYNCNWITIKIKKKTKKLFVIYIFFMNKTNSLIQ